MYKIIILLLSSLLLVTSCSNNDSTNMGGLNPLASVAAVTANGAPVVIEDGDALLADITALFGDSDSQPVEVQEGDTLQDVLSRAGL